MSNKDNSQHQLWASSTLQNIEYESLQEVKYLCKVGREVYTEYAVNWYVANQKLKSTYVTSALWVFLVQEDPSSVE